MSIENRKLKPGTTLVARHKGKEYQAKLIAGKDGKLRYRLKDGREFKSPSGAGSAVMGGSACNGWRFWSMEGTATPSRKTQAASAKPKARQKA